MFCKPERKIVKAALNVALDGLFKLGESCLVLGSCKFVSSRKLFLCLERFKVLFFFFNFLFDQFFHRVAQFSLPPFGVLVLVLE